MSHDFTGSKLIMVSSPKKELIGNFLKQRRQRNYICLRESGAKFLVAIITFIMKMLTYSTIIDGKIHIMCLNKHRDQIFAKDSENEVTTLLRYYVSIPLA